MKHQRRQTLGSCVLKNKSEDFQKYQESFQDSLGLCDYVFGFGIRDLDSFGLPINC